MTFGNALGREQILGHRGLLTGKKKMGGPEVSQRTRSESMTASGSRGENSGSRVAPDVLQHDAGWGCEGKCLRRRIVEGSILEPDLDTIIKAGVSFGEK